MGGGPMPDSGGGAPIGGPIGGAPIPETGGWPTMGVGPIPGTPETGGWAIPPIGGWVMPGMGVPPVAWEGGYLRAKVEPVDLAERLFGSLKLLERPV